MTDVIEGIGPANKVDERLYLQSVARALDVLECFAADPRPKSLGQIAEVAGVTKSAAQRITHTMIARGYLEQADGGGIMLGRVILDRTFDYLRSNTLIERAMPVMSQLRKTSGERVDLSLFDARNDNTSIVYAIRLQSKRETFYATLPGRRMPSCIATGGRICLAALPDAVVDDIIARSELRALTPRTNIEPAAIRAKIAEAREIGYAFAAEEALLGELVLAAAVFGPKGLPVGAVHIAGSMSDWSVEDFRARFAPLAIESARALST